MPSHTKLLREETGEYAKAASTQTDQLILLTRKLVSLTWVIAILTFVMLVGLVIQV